MKRSPLVAFLFLFVLILSGCSEEHKEYKRIIVGIDDELAPMTFKDATTGEITGFDIDIAKEVAKRLNIEIEFKVINWESKLDELKSERIDCIWSGMDITPERQSKILCSKPYMNNRQLLFVKKGNEDLIKFETDLAGKIVGVQIGSTAKSYFDVNRALKESLEKLQPYDDFNTEFNDLDDGRIDVAICDEIVGRYKVNQNKEKFEYIDLPIGAITQFGIGFRKEDTELCENIQRVLSEMVVDGTAKKISEKWFEEDLFTF